MATPLMQHDPAGAAGTIEAAIVMLARHFAEVPTRQGLEDLGVIAQMLSLNAAPRSLADARTAMADHVVAWLDAGLIEDLLCTESTQTYSIALLLGLVRQVAPARFDGRHDLPIKAVVVASEWPSMTSRIIRNALDFPMAASDDRETLRAIDKRVLRYATSAQDLEIVLQLAHCRTLDSNGAPIGSLLVNTLALQALRDDNHGWLAILGFLFRRIFVPMRGIEAAIQKILVAAAGQHAGPTAPPDNAASGSTWGSAGALRLRTGIALRFYLDDVRDVAA